MNDETDRDERRETWFRARGESDADAAEDPPTSSSADTEPFHGDLPLSPYVADREGLD